MKLIICLKAFSVGLIAFGLGIAVTTGILQHLISFQDAMNEFAFAGLSFTFGLLGILSSLTFKRQ
jgi:hypothetical protein